MKIDEPFDVQKEIQIFILRYPYNSPSEKSISAVLKRLEKELGREITFSYVASPLSGDDYLELICTVL